MIKISVAVLLFTLVFWVGCRPSKEPSFIRLARCEHNRMTYGLERLDDRFSYYTSKPAGEGLIMSYYKGKRSMFGIEVEKSVLHQDAEIVFERDLFYSGRQVKNGWQEGRDDGPVFERAWHQYVYNAELAKSAHVLMEGAGHAYYYCGGENKGRCSTVSKEDFERLVSGWRTKVSIK